VLDGPEPDWVDGDPADYTVGTLPSVDPAQPHRVVLCQLGGTAPASAAESVAHLIRSYPSVDQIVMTGVAAGFPAPSDPARHVRLGDILVATYGVVAYDHIVDRAAGSELRAGFPRPSVLLSRRVERLRGGVLLGERPWEALIERAVRAAPGFARPGDATDVLHDGDGDGLVPHPDPALSGHLAGRPKIHYGRIGSADRSLRHAVNRDELARRFGIIGVEMEGTAAFATGRSWFVVKGVSDYADRHMNQAWRNYAALASAAYVRSLLAVCPVVAPHAAGAPQP
jgi:nucleoside phosphorylase